MPECQVLVAGGGAAGMAAAVSAAESGAGTILLEKNEKLGKKLYITGHGRCNVTNVAGTQDFEARVFRNPRFPRSALRAFGSVQLREFLEKAGVPTKEEDSGRVFPRSDKSSDVIRAFSRTLDRLGVEVLLHEEIRSVAHTEKGFAVRTQDDAFLSRALILATGGVSYPSTGSTGDGARFAERLGHAVLPWQPGLVGLEASEPLGSLQGLTIQGVLSLYEEGRRVAREEGEILFTAHGLSGPAVFRAVCRLSADPAPPLRADIRLFPSRTEEQVRDSLVQAVSSAPNKDISTVLGARMPRRLAAAVLAQAGVPADQKGNQLKKADRSRVLNAMLAYSVPLSGTRPIEEAIISIGGVSVRDVNPSTMESRKVPGLFICGELLDVAAFTGGYNLQIAFSTGWSAGRSAARYVLDGQGSLA